VRLRRLLAGALSAAGLAATLGATASPGATPLPESSLTQPNVVLIVLDDARKDDLQAMPTVRALLGDRGASFDRYISSHSLCCPARMTLLRGQYTHNHGVVDVSKPDGGFTGTRKIDSSTLATWLQGGGYRTMLAGKYVNEYPAGSSYVPPGWSDWHATGPIRHNNFVASDNGVATTWSGYQADYVAERTSTFLRSSAGLTPFFAYVNPIAPHFPYRPAARHANAPVTVPPLPPSFNEADVSDKPAWVRALPPVDATTARTDQRQRYRMLLAVDEMVQRIVSDLTVTNELASTLIMFTSDNGYLLGEHRWYGGKRAAYEESISLPLLVRGPGIDEGRKVARLASTTDIAPTIADYAGVAAPSYVDGRSLRPLLEGRALPWRDAVLVEHFSEPSANKNVPSLAAVRTVGDRKLVEYPATGEREAYDLTLDPHELRNTPRAKWVPELRNRLAELRTCAAASCRAAEGP